MKWKLLSFVFVLTILCGFFIYSFNDDKQNDYDNDRSDDLKNKASENIQINGMFDKIEEDKKIKQKTLDKKIKNETNVDGNFNVDSNDNEINNDAQNNNYEYNESPNNNVIQDNIQNNIFDNSNIENNENIDNHPNTVPITIDDVGVDNNLSNDIYSTYEECNQAGIDLMLKVMSDDIINTFCFSYAENGKLVGYRLDINCKSGNCDKYK